MRVKNAHQISENLSTGQGCLPSNAAPPCKKDQKTVILDGPTTASAYCAMVRCIIVDIGVAEASTIVYVLTRQLGPWLSP